MAEGPSTVHKALSLLEFFDERRHRIGLSELSKLSGYNKATTMRFLAALESKGFVEQDEETRLFNLGPAFLRFSQLREASFPLVDAVKIVLRDLNAITGETAHASRIAGQTLANIATIESKSMNRVIIGSGESLPLHATASGLAYLAFAAPAFVEPFIEGGTLQSHTTQTQTDAAVIRQQLDQIRQTGLSISSGTFEEGVIGIAAPYFGPSNKVCGAVAVALPAVRATEAHQSIIEENVRKAAKRLTLLRGGRYPEAIDNGAVSDNG